MNHLGDLPDPMRTQPHAVGPEKSILSSMLQDPQEFIGLAIEERLTAAHFYHPGNATLFDFLRELNDKGEPIELVSLVQHLLTRGLLDHVGGSSGVTDIYTYAPTHGHFRHHLRIVKDAHTLREVIASAGEAVALVNDAPEDIDALLDATEARFLAIREGRQAIVSDSIRPALQNAVNELEDRVAGKPRSYGLATGFEYLDRMTGGLKAGELFIIGARPSMGKTSLMMNVVEHVTIDQALPAFVFSLEMSKDQLVSRSLYCRARFNPAKLAMGHNPDKGELARIRRAIEELHAARLFIDDTPAITISQLRAKARRKKRDVPELALIAVDYLQLMKSTSRQSEGSREREIAEISAGLKGLAKELALPIVVLAQLNRDVEKRSGKGPGVPRMSDLRESGSIEQDADYVALLNRPELHAPEEDREALAGKAVLILAKNRSGQTGEIPLTFIADLMRFESGTPYAEPPAPAPRENRRDWS